MNKKPGKPSQRGRDGQRGPKIEQRWVDLARQLAANPDDPASLRIVSAMNHAMRPAAQAAAQVVEALAEQLSAPSERTETAVAAAVRHWESVCKSPMDQEVMIGLKDEAVALVGVVVLFVHVWTRRPLQALRGDGKWSARMYPARLKGTAFTCPQPR